jgi:hypothetical protein
VQHFPLLGCGFVLLAVNDDLKVFGLAEKHAQALSSSVLGIDEGLLDQNFTKLAHIPVVIGLNKAIRYILEVLDLDLYVVNIKSEGGFREEKMATVRLRLSGAEKVVEEFEE